MSRTNPARLAVNYESHQQKRRDEALARQRSAREQHVNVLRVLAAAQHVEPGGGDDSDGAEDEHAASAPHHDMGEGTTSAEGDAEMGGQAHGPSTSGRHQPHGAHKHSGRQRAVRGRGRGRGRSGSGSGSALRALYAAQLQTPEWLTDIPHDLPTAWLVRPRPEGPRCLVITSRGRTQVRGRSGALLMSATTALPEGGPGRGASGQGCVLDCVLHEPTSTLYIGDVLVWRGFELDAATAELRAFWLQGKLAEEEGLVEALAAPPPVPLPTPHTHFSALDGAVAAAASAASEAGSMVVEGGGECGGDAQHSAGRHGRGRGRGRGGRGGGRQGRGGGVGGEGGAPAVPLRVVALPVWSADAAGLAAAYACGAEGCERFVRDGLWLSHREALYTGGGAPSSLSLVWKDVGCSRWAVDTDAAGVATPHQVVTLAYSEAGALLTSDEPPVALGALGDALAAAGLSYASPPAWVPAALAGGGVSSGDGSHAMDGDDGDDEGEAQAVDVSGAPAAPHGMVLQHPVLPAVDGTGPALKLRPGRLLRLTLREGGIRLVSPPDGGLPVWSAHLAYEGPANQRKGRADALSKVLFQHAARSSPITLQHLLAAASAPSHAHGSGAHDADRDVAME